MIHPSSDIQSSDIGTGTVIWQYCVVLPKAVIGRNCNINCNVFIENDVLIGDDVTIKSGVQIWDGVSLGNKVFIGPNVTFTNDLFPRSKQHLKNYVKTIIEEGASIGANSTIIAGVTIHKYAMIGAGSLIAKSVPPYTLWYGNPAKQQGYVTSEGLILNNELISKDGKKYQLINAEPKLV